MQRFVARRQKKLLAETMSAWLMARGETVMRQGNAALILQGTAQKHQVAQRRTSASRLLGSIEQARRHFESWFQSHACSACWLRLPLPRAQALLLQAEGMRRCLLGWREQCRLQKACRAVRLSLSTCSS